MREESLGSLVMGRRYGRGIQKVKRFGLAFPAVSLGKAVGHP
jgi:hypothetical protein